MKSVLSNISNEFIHGGHLFALGNSAILLAEIMLLKLPFNLFVVGIPYFITQIIYSYNHFKELDFDIATNPERAEYILKKKKWIGTLLVVYMVGLIIFSLLTNLLTFLLVVFIILGGVFYSVAFKEKVSKIFIGFKNIYTCFFWSLIIFFIPSFYNLQLTGFFIYFFIFIFIRGFIGMVFSDVKDIDSDSVRSLKTFAVVLGKQKVINFLYILNIIALIPLILGIYTSSLPIESIFLGFSSFYSIYYLRRSMDLDSKNLRKLSYVVVDGEYTFWPILIIIGMAIF